MDADILNTDQLRGRLGAECIKAGGQTAWARKHHVSVAYVNDVLRGRKRDELPDTIVNALGYKKQVNYLRKRKRSRRNSK